MIRAAPRSLICVFALLFAVLQAWSPLARASATDGFDISRYLCGTTFATPSAEAVAAARELAALLDAPAPAAPSHAEHCPDCTTAAAAKPPLAPALSAPVTWLSAIYAPPVGDVDHAPILNAAAPPRGPPVSV
jgi:hypothetical protein